MYLTQGLKRAMQINPYGIATIDATRKRTWQEFNERVARLAGAFRQLGLAAGERVAILALNGDRYLEVFYAVPWANGIFVPLNVRLTPPELIFMLNDSGAELLILDDAFTALLPEFNDKLTSVKHILYAGNQDPPKGTTDLEALLSTCAAIPDAERGGEEIAGIFYTGGTTGLPKGAMLTHNNMVSNTLHILGYMYRGQHWIWPHTAPMFYLADSSMAHVVTTLAGTHLFLPKFDAAETVKLIETHQATHCFMVPTMLNLITNLPDIQTFNLSSLQEIIYAGSPMPPAILAKAMTLLPQCRFVQGYGMTETSPCITFLESQYHMTEGKYADKLKSCGKPLFGVDVRIVDPEDHEVPCGVVGEIITRGPNVMQGYWNRPQETEYALRNGWMHTGDAGYMDEEGFVYIVDRYKDMIKTGGENVFSIEIENALYQHSGVSMCAVIGIPDAKWGEAVHAIVVPKEGYTVSEQEIMQHCHNLLAHYKCPHSVEIRQTPLPLSSAGKILKAKLRELYWQGRERQIA